MNRPARSASADFVDIVLTDAPDPEVRATLLDALVELNERHAGPHQFRPLGVLLKDPASGELLGGLSGCTFWSWLYVDLLHVPERLRGRGIGTELMRLAEEEAIARGCRAAWLDTFSFQARGFYERLGYAVFGKLENYPAGHQRLFMQKRLDAGKP